MIKTANLITINGKTQSGITSPDKAIVKCQDGAISSVILKRLDAKAMASEFFCANLLQSWGIPVPEPILVIDERKNDVFFGSLESPYPNLHQRLPHESDQHFIYITKTLSKLVRSWAIVPLAITADEAIDNRDRNLQNILWNGSDVLFIDHEKCLGIDANQIDDNKLAKLVQFSNEDCSDVIKKSISSIKEITLDSIEKITQEVQEIINNSTNGTVDVNSFSSYISQRIPVLTDRIINRFPLALFEESNNE